MFRLPAALRRPVALAAACLALPLAACADSDAGTKRQIDVHDPVMAKEDDTYYLFSTGPGITIYRSDDLHHWQFSGRGFESEPTWAKNVSPGFGGHLWAPDIIEHDGRFYLYYSVSAFGKNTSAIGVTVSDTLNPDSPDYGWEDQGIVVQSVPHRDHWNAIDPAIIFGEDGTPWMSFGSFWEGLKLVKLDDSLTRLAEPQEWHTIARGERPQFHPVNEPGPEEIEAPFIFRKNGYYYLFISRGLCCKGDDSTYRLAVGRSQSVTGPYMDKDGVDLANGGGTPLISGNKAWPGLGHNSAYTFDGKDYLVLHAYESADKGLQKLKIMDIEWDDDLWPVVDPAQLDSFKAYKVK
ncbi:arabinan endo-1,5-alpha-L-arabinosidase [Microbulbifer celer]|uniref:Extracellular exo-alpha-(1->5)-L-arabinofuranosidase n=1 Tax=Microbulbifer celer TaxID=435905 RepID=A0ABW3U9G9_9GAMM|nr:arabinan endo-1,5-alpha-L-arabinosidase [Microbulbifer celer]UFN57532.1 arabinan endo-1,5-alpha-L-arabinosidase [Microbulbifer celer]